MRQKKIPNFRLKRKAARLQQLENQYDYEIKTEQGNRFLLDDARMCEAICYQMALNMETSFITTMMLARGGRL